MPLARNLIGIIFMVDLSHAGQFYWELSELRWLLWRFVFEWYFLRKCTCSLS